MRQAALPGGAAFEQLYRSCYGRLVGQLFLVTTDRAEAEEAVQEAFTRLWAKWPELQDYDNPEAWIRHVALNIAVSRWRQRRRSVQLPAAEGLAVAPGPDGGDLVAALRTLPAKQRQALVLHHVAGLSVAEVAAEMSARPGTVKSWLSRGRTALARLVHDAVGARQGGNLAMTDSTPDPVAQLLKDRAARVAAQVTPPGWRSVVERHARRVGRQRLHRMLAAAAAAVIVAAVAIAAIVVPPATGHRQRAVAYPVRFGGRVYLVRDLRIAQQAAPALSRSHITASHLRVVSPNYASIAFGHGSVWVLTHQASGNAASSCGKLVRVSAATNAVTGAVPIRLCPDGVAYGQGSVWVLSFAINVRGYQLVRVNPATLAIESLTPIDAGRHGVTPHGDTGAKYLFVAVTRRLVFTAVQDAQGRSQIAAIDPATGTVATTLTFAPSEAVSAVAATKDAVWVGTNSGRVLGLAPETGAVKFARRVGARVISLSASGRGVWVSVNLPAPPRAQVPGLDVLRLDPATGAIVTDTGLPMIFTATGGATVWALSSEAPFSADAGLVAQISPTTGAIMKRAQLPTLLGTQPPYTIGVYRGSAWVINGFRQVLTKVSR